MRAPRPRQGEGLGSEVPPSTVTPVLVAELLAEGERMPVYVQRRALDDARSQDDYTIREWVEAPGLQYVPVDRALELLPGLRLVPAPATREVRRWSSWRRAGVRSSSVATWRSSSPSSTSRAPKASD